MQQATADAFRSSEADIVLLSPTGSGKTLAYLLPLVEAINAGNDEVQAVVITPSRELALQTEEVVRRLPVAVRCMACYGGRPAMDEHRRMQAVRPHIVVATPGRLLDHLSKQNFPTDGVRWLVIDEFDKSLELGFHDEMQQAIRLLPTVRRRILLSATDAEQIPAFVRLSQALRLDFLPSADDGQDKQRVKFYYVSSPTKDKLPTLADLLRAIGQQQSIVFLNYRDAVERVFHFLRDQGVACEMFHGGMDQEHRERAIYKFSNGTARVLVSTDLGSRGLDIPHVDAIVHYHLPLDADAYTHRNGRTARWDATGTSFLLLNDDEVLPEYLDERSVHPFYIPRHLLPVPQPSMATLYVGKGKKDKLSKADILGLLCKQGQLEPGDVGRIDVRDHCSYAAVSRAKMPALLRRLDGQKIKGIKTLFREAR